MQTELPAVQCEGLVKTYARPTGVVYALKSVDASFPWGAVSAVVGPSGSGKSSLLRIVAGMDRPTSGSVAVDGALLERASARKLRRMRHARVGYVFQRPSDNFIPHLSVGAHLDMAARGRGTQDGSRALLGRLGLAQRRTHLPHQLSGGEQQRAAFAQAVAAGCRVIVADEPTAELDTVSARELLTIARDLAGEGFALVFATHDPLVVDAATAGTHLDHGEVRVGGRPEIKGKVIPTRASRGATGARARSGLLSRTPVVRVEGVTKSYRRGPEIVHALQDVSCDLFPGEIVGLVGRSGSGKSTLLNILAGWERPDAGTVDWVGLPQGAVHDWQEVAVVPQKLGLIEELTVQENVAYPLRRPSARSASSETVELLESLRVAHLHDRFPHETSVGEQQRVALARALVIQPTIVLADEPTGHQDDKSADAVLAALRAAADGGSCCVIATHNLDLVDRLDRVLQMTDGTLAQATAADLLNGGARRGSEFSQGGDERK